MSHPKTIDGFEKIFKKVKEKIEKLIKRIGRLLKIK